MKPRGRSSRVPPFDLLLGEPAPFEGFGPAHLAATAEVKQLLAAIRSARDRLEDGFSVTFCNRSQAQLDPIVADMWKTGWSAATEDVNAFATDLGRVLAGRTLRSRPSPRAPRHGRPQPRVHLVARTVRQGLPVPLRGEMPLGPWAFFLDRREG